MARIFSADWKPSPSFPLTHFCACRAFVSGEGTYQDYGGVDVDIGDVTNAEDIDLGWATCYGNQDNNCDAIFPFHWCCYELLSKCITGSFDDDDLDKDLLYSIMQDLLVDFGRSFEKIDYGDASHMQDQFWQAVPGYEYLVSHPRDVPSANEAVLSIFASDAFKQRSSSNDLGRRVRSDPFLRTPYDIICRIAGFISDDDLVNLNRASWPIHALLQNNDQFWRQRLKASFPWFFELRELLERDQTLLQTNNPQRIFQWAERLTRPEKWMTGPLMGLANRRRIWSACEQLNDFYRKKEEVENDDSISDEERLIRKYSKCDFSVVVSSPEPTKLNPACTVYWLKSWSEARSQTKTLESFWDRHGSLVGISLTPDGQERRLLGLAGSDDDDGIVRESIKLGTEEWIKGLIVHLPVPTYLNDNGNRLVTSPKGLTVSAHLLHGVGGLGICDDVSVTVADITR